MSEISTLNLGEVSQIRPKKGGKTVSERRRRLRETLWPEVAESDLWLRKQRFGFTTIPRTMSVIGRIMDQMSGKGFPIFSTYLTLWCWVFDEGLVEIRNPREFAFESGFSGPRAESTWKSRMKRLEDLGFIKAKPGLAGDYQYVVLINPIKQIDSYYKDRSKDTAYNAFHARLSQVGADDLDA